MFLLTTALCIILSDDVFGFKIVYIQINIYVISESKNIPVNIPLRMCCVSEKYKYLHLYKYFYSYYRMR